MASHCLSCPTAGVYLKDICTELLLRSATQLWQAEISIALYYNSKLYTVAAQEQLHDLII